MKPVCLLDGGPTTCNGPLCYLLKECSAMKPPFVRSEFNYDMNEASDASGLACKDKSLAQQQFKEEADINTIVERFHLTGQVPQLAHLPQYGDYEGIFDFQSAMNTIRSAQEQFMSLPANIRARFHNEPQEFLEFCNNKENHAEARKLGILAPESPPKGATDGQATTESSAAAPETKTGKAGARGAQETPSKPQGAE